MGPWLGDKSMKDAKLKHSLQPLGNLQVQPAPEFQQDPPTNAPVAMTTTDNRNKGGHEMDKDRCQQVSALDKGSSSTSIPGVSGAGKSVLHFPSSKAETTDLGK